VTYDFEGNGEVSMAATAEDPRTGRRTVAVLGGTGFIGGALCRYLADHGHEVVAVSRRAAPGGAGRARALDLSTAGSAEVEALLREEGVDAVVNAAGGMWGLTDDEMVAANVTLVTRLLEAVARIGDRVRLVQVGSVHEYGLAPIGTSLGEDSPTRPVMHYGELKARCTQMVTEAAARGDVDGLTLRIGNVVGAGQPEVSLLGVVARQLRDAARESRPAVLNLGHLGSQRDFVGLGDSVRAVYASVTGPGPLPPVVNIGSGVATPARNLVRELIEVSGVPTELNEAPRQGPPEETWHRLRIDLAREALGWSPSLGLREDMKGLWEYCDSNVGDRRANG
jgi:dTDP-6-deoxy-L-talose 4-dehydrogenase [NAD(P)+]